MTLGQTKHPMSDEPVVSLCIPTNGISKWFFPVIDSIYDQGISEGLYEIVVTDNGNDREFKKRIKDYINKHQNIVYAETNALPFINEIESYKRASGQLIKYVNHRTRLMKGTLDKLIDVAEKYCDEKPIIYYSNGELPELGNGCVETSFDMFVRKLSFLSSWSTGMTLWKSDFEKNDTDSGSYNELFPHMNLLFSERKRDKYIIDNTRIFDEIDARNKKGRYDVFYAFGVEYPAIILELYRNGDITLRTYKSVVDRNCEFVANLFLLYKVLKLKCSYDLGGLKDIFGIFYNRSDLIKKSAIIIGRYIHENGFTALSRAVFRNKKA